MSDCILMEAKEIIGGERLNEYGPAEESFLRIAELWKSYLGAVDPSNLNGHDVANMMILMKVARTLGSKKRDNYTDIAGYAALGERLKK